MLPANSETIYYLCPDYPTPSWGIGLLYAHVRLLCQNGINAVIVHQQSPFRLDWLDADVPVRYLDDSTLQYSQHDILVVPEVSAALPHVQESVCRKVVFVQGSFLIHKGLGEAADLASLGFERAIATLPHMKSIIENHYSVDAEVISPYIAPYFFLEPSAINSAPRKKQIVTVPKPGYEAVGYFDYQVLRKQLLQRLEKNTDWELVELSGEPHKEVAQIMQQAAFFVSVNCLEGFNTTVPEAMAAGCIPVCYDAFGTRDFLKYQENSYVFPNNHLYPLLECLYGLLEQFDAGAEKLASIRAAGYRTAEEYRESRTEQELLRFFS